MLDLAQPSIMLALAVALLWTIWAGRAKKGRLPPGPPRLPLVGNLLQMPSTDPWETYLAWKDVYGARLHFLCVGRHSPLHGLMSVRLNSAY